MPKDRKPSPLRRLSSKIKSTFDADGDGKLGFSDLGAGAKKVKERAQDMADSAADAATREYAALAKKYKMSLTELAIRWAQQRSAVTSTLLGHTSMAQLDETLAFYAKKEPLPEQLLWEVDRVHMKNRNPIWSSTRVGKDWDGQGEIGEPIP